VDLLETPEFRITHYQNRRLLLATT
jgi:hypothetical protein